MGLTESQLVRNNTELLPFGRDRMWVYYKISWNSAKNSIDVVLKSVCNLPPSLYI